MEFQFGGVISATSARFQDHCHIVIVCRSVKTNTGHEMESVRHFLQIHSHMYPMSQNVLWSGALDDLNSIKTSNIDSEIAILVNRDFVNAAITFAL